jgi:glycosyltransferase involved in cell wall biosynthesis
MRQNKSILIIGQVPPPFMGPTVATEIILNSNLKKEFKMIHCDISDHRGLNNLSSRDLTNFFLAVKHYITLFKLIILNRPDLVYLPLCQTTLGYYRDIGFILIAKLLRRKLICHLRGGNFKNWYTTSSRFTQCVVRTVQSLVDGQIVLGEKLRYMFEELIPRNRIFVVPNGRDLCFPGPRRAQPDKIRILYLSNFIREKGIFEALEAIEEVHRQFQDIEFVAAGETQTEAMADLYKFIRKKSSLPIKILGSVFGQNKSELFSASDIFVFPTYYPAEGHPWVIVEAMAAGLPIITTDQGAILESVKNGVNGFIVEKRNPHQIAEKIKFLIEHIDIRKKMGEESRRLYLENFTEERMVERLSFAFNSVLAS